MTANLKTGNDISDRSQPRIILCTVCSQSCRDAWQVRNRKLIRRSPTPKLNRMFLVSIFAGSHRISQMELGGVSIGFSPGPHQSTVGTPGRHKRLGWKLEATSQQPTGHLCFSHPHHQSHPGSRHAGRLPHWQLAGTWTQKDRSCGSGSHRDESFRRARPLETAAGCGCLFTESAHTAATRTGTYLRRRASGGAYSQIARAPPNLTQTRLSLVPRR